MNIQKFIKHTALSYVDKEEVKGNQGFKDQVFENLMKKIGWELGDAWCAYFVELAWFMSGISEDDLFSGGAVKTWNNFDKSEDYTCNQIPEVGSIMIMQRYKNGLPDWRGHAGVVVAIQGGQIVTVEGNTNSKGGREGIEVALKIRALNVDNNHGLRMRGFIHPNGS